MNKVVPLHNVFVPKLNTDFSLVLSKTPLTAILWGYCMNIGEYCPEQYIILHELASAT